MVAPPVWRGARHDHGQRVRAEGPTDVMLAAPGTVGVGREGGVTEGRTKNPWPQVLLGSGLLMRCSAFSFR